MAYEDDKEFARSSTTGEEFVTDAAQCSVPDFPAPGENVSTQRFELARVTSYRLLSGEASLMPLGAERTSTHRKASNDAAGECYPCGQVATDALRQKLIGNNTVSCYLGDRDIYGRACPTAKGGRRWLSDSPGPASGLDTRDRRCPTRPRLSTGLDRVP